MKYGLAAAVFALAIIAGAVIAAPYLSNTAGKTTSNTSVGSSTNQAPGNFLILLTDPPTVPAGTTQLNVTYSGISLQVKYANGTSATVPVAASGTVNLLSLVNVSQTIGSAKVPAGSTVTSIEFTLSSASAIVSGVTRPVTLLSSQLVVPIRGGQVLNQTGSAALLDLRPTLVQVDATNSTGGAVSYYVLVPSATAIVKSNVSQGQDNVGTRTHLDQGDQNELENASQTGMSNVTITADALHTAGNVTTFSVTLKNQGTSNATIFGLTLHGNFSSSVTSNACNTTTSSTSSTSSSSTTSSNSNSSGHGNEGNPPGQNSSDMGQGQGQGQGQRHEGCSPGNSAHDHPQTIPFKVNGTSLAPNFGDGSDHSGTGSASSVTLGPGQSITLTFTGVLGIKTDNGQHGQNFIMGAISGNSYTIRLDGEGFQTAQVVAT